jgi:nitrite reductase/ring-hydroxylating ferredoxin subunit
MVSRRAVIASAVGVSAVTALAACSPQGANEPGANQSEAPAENSSAPVEVCKTTDIPVGSSKKFDVSEFRVLITHPTQDVFRGFIAACTHSGAEVSDVVDSEIECPAHFSVFNADDGSVIKGPAQRALGKVKVEVQGDAVLVSVIAS